MSLEMESLLRMAQSSHTGEVLFVSLRRSERLKV
jgi:hypothetical protein